MKNVIFIFSFMLIAGSVSAQKIKGVDVPDPVKAKFETLYPKTKVKKWVSEGPNYEAQFDKNKKEMCAVFSPDAKLVQTEESEVVSALPKAVIDYAESNYPGKKLSQAAKITDVAGKITYEVEVDKTYLVFDSNGNIIDIEKEPKTPWLKRFFEME